ncbi:hypothetical protein RJ639_012081 [Escallonia herrerae]|uniref:peroxidase n=1 Tax=Escallonia herrerae TaxID=1293975 RepID=A0AA89AQI9_9ASTE|nr:hypothetical protein RJ639_012081 [Escallonia herrerae]
MVFAYLYAVPKTNEASSYGKERWKNFTCFRSHWQLTIIICQFHHSLITQMPNRSTHTIGVTHCALLLRRLYNFTGHGDVDPSLNPEYAATLRTICPLPLNPNTTVDMDPDQSSLSFDSHYFKALNQKKGIFLSDAALLTNSNSLDCAILQNNPIFLTHFAHSVKKMGGIGILSEGDGEVRQNCRVVNV